MRCALVLLAIVLPALAALAPACGFAPSTPPAAVVSPNAVRAEAAPERAVAKSCRAVPSTIYGDEPIVFEIEGSPSALLVDVELVDQQGHSFATATAKVPGDWRPAAVPSGDFRLQVGATGVTCAVTVNRELPRATQPR